ncbi:MAG TPA: hypothetical protein VMS65_03245, partial [Polyangiaceae bacterium]|nr:hypothetical protein [Polyangiaceae bacterium]
AALTACGKSKRSDDGDASAGDAGASFGGSGGSLGGTSATGGTAGVAENGCVVVRRIDCCSEPFAVSASELASDECLMPVDGNLIDGARLDRCAASLPPPNCLPKPCSQPPTLSRSAIPDGNGGCRITDECDDASDCTFASQCCACCACIEPMPKGRAWNERCVLAEDPTLEREPAPEQCVTCPGGNTCLGCRHEGELSCSATSSGFRRCQWGPALPEDACTNERPCLGRFAPARCIGPEDRECGGPAPPPDECSEDADCVAIGDPVICEPNGHCGMRQCVPGCLSDGDCGQGTVCGSGHRCEPKPCTNAAACGPNFECTLEGLCERHRCLSTTNCEGYCVNGRCYDAPGQCRYPLP